MAKMGCFVGVVLIVVGVVLMVGMILLLVLAEPDHAGDRPTQWLETIFCKSGETYTQREYSNPEAADAETYIDMYCADETGRTRDVTGQMVLLAAVAFLAPFLLGFYLVMRAVRKMVFTRLEALAAARKISPDQTST